MSVDYLLGIAGIVVSLVLFLIGYRQTVGAKRERTFAAIAEIEKILVRRVVLESYSPKVQDIERLIEGKARDFRVARSDLISIEQLLNTLFTRIVESDLIPQTSREDIIGRIMPAITESEREKNDERVMGRPSSLQGTLREVPGPSVALAIIASIIGATTAFLPYLKSIDVAPKQILLTAAGTLVGSFVMIMVVIIYRRIKDSQEVDYLQSGMTGYSLFENEVMQMLRKAKVTFLPLKEDQGADFFIENRDKKILIEVKHWRHPVSAQIVNQVYRRLGLALQRNSADLALLVTPLSLSASLAALIEDKEFNVRMVGIKELKTFLASQT